MNALVTCGGWGACPDADVEKPLYRVGGEPTLDRVLRAVAAADVEAASVAVPPTLPETRARLGGTDRQPGDLPARYADLPVDELRVVDAPGDGDASDLEAALEAVGRPVVAVAANLPLLSPEHVDRAIEASDRGERSLSVRVPTELKRRLGVTCDDAIYGNAPTGLNVHGPPDVPGGTLRSYDARLAVAVHTPEDARVAEALL